MFQVGQTVVAKEECEIQCSPQKGAGITPGKEYEVIAINGNEIIVKIDSGPTTYRLMHRFKAKIEDKKLRHNNVVVGNFVIGSLHPQNGLSVSFAPQLQITEEEAKKECGRLALLEPTKKFIYFEIKGACEAVGVKWE